MCSFVGLTLCWGSDVFFQLAGFRMASILVYSSGEEPVALSDKAGIKLFSCAVSGGVEYIVSGDRLVHEIEQYKGIQVVSLAMFLQLHGKV